MIRKPPVLPPCTKGYYGMSSILIPGINTKVTASCQDGWIVFQKRTSNSVSFYRNWVDYKRGFGDSENAWLGNDNIHKLTKAGYNKLRIELKEADGHSGFGEWTGFAISNEANKFRLSVGKMTAGTIGNDFGGLNG